MLVVTVRRRSWVAAPGSGTTKSSAITPQLRLAFTMAPQIWRASHKRP